MLHLFLVLLFGLIRAIYIAFLNGAVFWFMFKLLEYYSLTTSLSYLICVVIAFVPGWIISCIRIHKQVTK